MLLFESLMLGSLRDSGLDVQSIRPSIVFGRFFCDYKVISKWASYVDKYVLFPVVLCLTLFFLRRKKSVFIHVCDHSNAIYLNGIGDVPHLVTCHDVMAIQSAMNGMAANKTGFLGKVLQRLILRGLRKARHIVCVSENTRKDLLRILGSSKCIEPTITMSLNFSYKRTELEIAHARLNETKYPIGEKVVLHVGDNSWYKNREGILLVCARLKSTLLEECPFFVFIGKHLEKKHLLLIDELEISDRVISLGQVTDELLEAAYSTADVFLFPSYYEGFGWPPIEAQACGCPVVASGGGSLGEVLGDSAMICDPQDIEQMADAVEEILSNEESKGAFIDKGYENVKRFDKKKMSDAYVEVYRSIWRDAV